MLRDRDRWPAPPHITWRARDGCNRQQGTATTARNRQRRAHTERNKRVQRYTHRRRNKDRRRCQLKTLISLIRLMTVSVDTPRGQLACLQKRACCFRCIGILTLQHSTRGRSHVGMAYKSAADKRSYRTAYTPPSATEQKHAMRTTSVTYILNKNTPREQNT